MKTRQPYSDAVPCPVIRHDYERIDDGVPIPVRCTRAIHDDQTAHADLRNGIGIEWRDGEEPVADDPRVLRKVGDNYFYRLGYRTGSAGRRAGLHNWMTPPQLGQYLKGHEAGKKARQTARLSTQNN